MTGQYIVLSNWIKNVEPDSKITNIVYMGQGEPLHNFDNMKEAAEIFLDDYGLGLGQRRITLSGGMVPKLKN